MNKIIIKNIEINITGIGDDDYISLTDLARMLNKDDPRYPIQNWMRLKDTIEFIGLWELLNNEHFNRVEFDAFKSEAGRNSFVMTPSKWIRCTNAIGFKSKSGKYGGGTFAHRDIALEFASWISAEIKLYIIKEFQRLKIQESEQLEWQGKRLLTKLNYLIHTEAVKEYLVPIELSNEQKSYITAKQWKDVNLDKEGNVRDYANTIELAILSNLEYLNSMLIAQKLSQKDRLVLLNKEANREKELFNKNNIKSIKRLEKK